MLANDEISNVGILDRGQKRPMRLEFATTQLELRERMISLPKFCIRYE
jgi:hypothetical protein